MQGPCGGRGLQALQPCSCLPCSHETETLNLGQFTLTDMFRQRGWTWPQTARPVPGQKLRALQASGPLHRNPLATSVSI